MSENDASGVFVRLTRHQMRRLRFLREAYEEMVNETGLRDHLAAGLPKEKYRRKQVHLGDLVGRAVDLFLAPLDLKVEETKEKS